MDSDDRGQATAAAVKGAGTVPNDAALLVVGDLVLDRKVGTLSGPAGQLQLQLRPSLAVLAVRLMVRPGALVSNDQLLEALYGEDDAEPENSLTVMRMGMRDLRAAVQLLCGSTVRVRNERLLGYAMDARDRARW